jgi:hypothetical protein
MDLLWRNNITPNKVVLGTAFYGRAFTASSPNCLSPGCTFDSGAKKGPCSQEVSILLGSEITDIIESTGNKPVLDKDAAVKILTYNEDQWVAYDDADTLKMKANFARSQCMGGLMVWAVSHDTPDGSFTKALATAANRKIVALQETSDEDTSTTTVTQFPQCKWTNCKEGWFCTFCEDFKLLTLHLQNVLPDGPECCVRMLVREAQNILPINLPVMALEVISFAVPLRKIQLVVGIHTIMGNVIPSVPSKSTCPLTRKQIDRLVLAHLLPTNNRAMRWYINPWLMP